MRPIVELCSRELVTAEEIPALLDGTLAIGFLCEGEAREGLLLESILREPFIAVLPSRHQLVKKKLLSDRFSRGIVRSVLPYRSQRGFGWSLPTPGFNCGLVFEDLGGLPGGGVFLLEGARHVGQGNRGGMRRSDLPERALPVGGGVGAGLKKGLLVGEWLLGSTLRMTRHGDRARRTRQHG